MNAGGFVKAPDALLYDPELSADALRAYLVLAGYARASSCDTFEMTADTLGTLLGRSHDRANRYTRELEGRGLLSIQRNRGRGRPNLITVLDPQGVVFAGLHIAEGARGSASPKAHAKTREPGDAKTRNPYREGREVREGQRKERTASGPKASPPVDDGGAARTPRPRCPKRGHEHATYTSLGQCSHCRSEELEDGWSRSPAF